ATPGRHTQGWGSRSFKSHLVNASGLCGFGYFSGEPQKWIQGFLASVTGLERSWQELEVNAQRIMAIRQAFNSREGINPRKIFVHPRIMSVPLTAGPTKGQTVDLDKQVEEGCKQLDWDPATGKPNKSKLVALGMGDVAKDLWR
ncbi:MAG: aldehyde ferredoxin oxidoreductase C-terminal domain-containing protein, partial [Chloroflexota bacterium]|nr:aldehyde ferredoxin oxidoreductase C-terminal domain-containing protein [Chloroflexota bacterium]